MARKSTKKAAPVPALYYIRKGLVEYTDEAGTRVERGPGGKVLLTEEEVADLPDGVELETPEQRETRLGADKLTLGIVRSPAAPVQPDGGISEATANKLIQAIDKSTEVSEKLLAAMNASAES